MAKLRKANESSPIGIADRWPPSILVSSLYQVALGRYPSESNLENDLRQLRDGVSFDDLASLVAESPDFRDRHGPSDEVNATFLDQLHRTAFERKAEPEWIASLLGAGRKRVTRAHVLASIARSEEMWLSLVPPPWRKLVGASHSALLIHSLYQTAFGRHADPGGLAGYLKQLQKSASLEKIAQSLVDSPEFRLRHGPSRPIDFQFVMDLYRDAFSRRPAPEELSVWLAKGEKGASRANIVAVLAGSEEALDRLKPSMLNPFEKYSRWVKYNDTIGDADRVAIRAQTADLTFRPLFSIVLTIDTVSLDKLRQSLDSMRTQLYWNWELCLAIDPLTEPILNDFVHHSAVNAIRSIQVEANMPSADKLNAALGLSSGDYVLFFRAGDLLPEQSLYEVAFEIGQNTAVDILYTDRDQIDQFGRRFNPWFKPGWDPDLLLAHNYLNDLTVYRRELLQKIGFMRVGFEGAEFHDLALRATGATSSARIRHIPAILYHRRDDERLSDGEGDWSNSRMIAATRRAVRDHLNSQGYTSASVTSSPGLSGAIRVLWPVPEPEPLVSVIMPTRDRGDLVAQCIDGLLHRTAYSNLEILIVNNGSTEPESLALFDRLEGAHERVRILNKPGPFNFAALTNAGAREALGEVLLLLNNDIDVIEAGWLREMVSQAIRREVGAVGAKLLYENEKIQHAGIVLGPNGATMHLSRFSDKSDSGYFGQLAVTRSLSAVTAACLAIRRKIFFEVGSFDAVNLAVAYNDVDLCLKLGQAGYRTVWTPFAELFHLESVSRGRDDANPISQARSEKEWMYLRRKWQGLLENDDPFHNPNLLFEWDQLDIPSFPRRPKPWYSVVLNSIDRLTPRK